MIELSGKVLLGQVDAETFKKNRIAFFEKYETDQQQALPVVPECVAEWIEILKTKGLKPLKNPETYEETGFTEETLQNIVFWISEHQEDYMRAWLDGYTVEKPQLFYLKNKLTGAYLYYDEATNYYYDSDIVDYLDIYYEAKAKFTQQEIDSMKTGSYELVPVEDGE
ncbi:putative phage related protein [Lactococcus cremoris subsp. cremoris GE214]|uniref:Putative phage related protein n=1 Tax=Lactococcus cremoris subsp. cremoris GE214 TaxID=1415168 RepID=A0A084AA93_LACLC|nr:putative phage related protein [Lactococcus cremoris subsp. cremoris GE214]